MDDLTLARAIHVAAIVHWIGGVSFVTLVFLPGVRNLAEPQGSPVQAGRRRFFPAGEDFRNAGRADRLLHDPPSVRVGPFSRFRLLVDAFNGHGLAHLYAGPVRVRTPRPASLVCRATQRAPERTMVLVRRGHLVLLALSLVTVITLVLGAHGALY
jgi:hypothetical protein